MTLLDQAVGTTPPPCHLSIVGDIVTATEGGFSGEVRITDGTISSVHRGVTDGGYEQRRHLGRTLLLPGFVDAHVHVGTTDVDGMARTTRAAAAGGVTTLIDMPFDAGGVVDNAVALEKKAERIRHELTVDVALLATVHPRTPTDEVHALAAAGGCGVVVSLFEQDPVRYPKIGYHALHELMTAVAELDLAVSLHPETDELIKPGLAAARSTGGPGDWRLHARTRPPVSELHAVVSALELALDAGARLHLHQVSLDRSHLLAARYRGDGARVTAESLIHYLLLAEDSVQRLGARAKVNPPLRGAANRERLWERLACGEIDVIASDHTPWPVETKSRPRILDNESGAPSLQIYPSLLIGAALARGVPLTEVAAAAAWRPAQVFDLAHVKGDIRAGSDADLLIFDPDEEWSVDPAAMYSAAGWTPYDGCRQRGRVVTTIVRGEVVWDEQGLKEDVTGRVLRRDNPPRPLDRDGVRTSDEGTTR